MASAGPPLAALSASRAVYDVSAGTQQYIFRRIMDIGGMLSTPSFSVSSHFSLFPSSISLQTTSLCIRITRATENISCLLTLTSNRTCTKSPASAASQPPTASAQTTPNSTTLPKTSSQSTYCFLTASSFRERKRRGRKERQFKIVKNEGKKGRYNR